jgi:hypothetical protein
VIDTENMRTSGRHGQKLHKLGFGTLDAEGNWEPFEPVPLTQMRPTWNGWPWWVLALSVAGLIAVVDGPRFDTAWRIRCSFRRPERDTGEVGTGFGRWWLIEPGSTVSAVVKTMYAAAKMIVEHELLEAFKFDGGRPFDPHRTVQDLVSTAPGTVITSGPAPEAEPMIAFTFEGRCYEAPMAFYQRNRVRLPDGRALHAKGGWYETMPPTPSTLEVCPDKDPTIPRARVTAG